VVTGVTPSLIAEGVNDPHIQRRDGTAVQRHAAPDHNAKGTRVMSDPPNTTFALKAKYQGPAQTARAKAADMVRLDGQGLTHAGIAKRCAVSVTSVSRILAEKQQAHGTEYLSKLPRAVPPGKRLVHNSVKASRKQGERGARYWLASDGSDQWPLLIPCGCDFAGELGRHYRVWQAWTIAPSAA
jgi:hypothetical protein